MDCYGFRGVARPLCPKCNRRVWIQGDGHEVIVTRIDKKPSRLPKAVATA
jgi:5-methylcytosine-specific restriction endonuclease McrA